MGSMPFLLVGSVGGWLLYASRRGAGSDAEPEDEKN
jgi:hypothetical protein